MSTTVVTARLTEEELAGLDTLAAIMDRSRAWLVAKAINRYVEAKTELLAFVRQGIDDIEGGRFQTQEEVEAMFGVRRDERDAA